MARKVSDRADEEAQREEEVAPIVAQPNEFVPVAPVSQDAFFQAQQQAQISGADSDTVPQHMVEAANRGRLARGEEPVVVGGHPGVAGHVYRLHLRGAGTLQHRNADAAAELAGDDRG